MKTPGQSIEKRARTGAGFTLIEVIVTLGVFVLLTASVFGIMTAVFQSSNALKENQNRKDEITALDAFLKNRFENLGPADLLETYRRDDEEGVRINGILMISQDRASAVDVSRQANGLYNLRLASPDAEDANPTVSTFSQQLNKNQSALAWTLLINDVRSISWKFQSMSTPDWLDDWTQDVMKPAIVECTVTLAGDTQPTVMDFPIPHLVPSPSQTAVAPHAP